MRKSLHFQVRITLKTLICLVIFSGTSLSSYAATPLTCGNGNSELVFEALAADDLQSDYNQKDPLDKSFWNLYHKSFSEKVRAEPSEIINHFDSQTAIALRVRRQSNTLGMAIAYMVEDVPVSYITYLAVDESLQSKGLGKDIFNCIKAETDRRFSEKQITPWGIVYEMEIPELTENDEEKSICEKRLATANRSGSILVSKDYFCPPLRPDEPIVPLYLLMFPLSLVDFQDPTVSHRITQALHR